MCKFSVNTVKATKERFLVETNPLLSNNHNIRKRAVERNHAQVWFRHKCSLPSQTWHSNYYY